MRHSHALTAIALHLVGLGACFSEPPKPPAPDKALHELDLRELPPELAPPSLLGSERPGFREVLAEIRKLAIDPKSDGLFLQLGSLGGAWGARQDLAEALNVYRATEKPVHCHAEGLDNAAFALAAESCDRLSMTPAGTLNLVGLAMQLLHAHELLESLGVQAEMLQVGKYKGAAEPFTRDTMSEPFAESLNALLDDLDDQFRSALKERVEAGDPTAGGPYTPREALEAGLIDAIEYDDAARATAMTASAAENHVKLYAPPPRESLDIATLWKALTQEPDDSSKKGTRIAYVVLSGEIIDGDTPVLNRIVAGPTIAAMRRLADDPGVKAAVIRIDSPGGSALASDRVWHAVRRIAGKKPVAVSVGNMAASGGYYIASAGSRVFASPASLVGSIGVVGGKVSVAGLADTYGVHADTLSRGPRATWLSPFSPFTDEQRGQLEHLLQRTYRLFLHRIAVGRKLKVSALYGFTEGRLMTGRRAQRGQLVDELGGLTEAFAWVRSEAKVSDEIAIETWPDEEDAMAALAGMLGSVQSPLSGARLRELLLEAAPGPIPAWLRTIATGQHTAVALPWHISIH